eukprot:3020198-Alexandrium_andersonii.AAC.1
MGAPGLLSGPPPCASRVQAQQSGNHLAEGVHADRRVEHVAPFFGCSGHSALLCGLGPPVSEEGVAIGPAGAPPELVAKAEE